MTFGSLFSTFVEVVWDVLWIASMVLSVAAWVGAMAITVTTPASRWELAERSRAIWAGALVVIGAGASALFLLVGSGGDWYPQTAFLLALPSAAFFVLAWPELRFAVVRARVDATAKAADEVVEGTPKHVVPNSVPGVAKADPIIVADDVTRAFGGLTAVDVDHLEVQRGWITALIGPNGAGKSTLFNLITGFDKADTGSWTVGGVELSRLPAFRYPMLGVVRTFQLTKALSRLTVIENMRLGAQRQQGEFVGRGLLPFVWGPQEAEITRRADELLDRFKLSHMREEFAGTLSGGQRKLLEMARALMAQPQVIMLDEPMAGVNPALTQSLLGHITSLRDEGITVMFVEHDMDVVRDISDWVVVMAQGQIIAESPPSEVGANQAVIDAYLGAHHDAPLTLEDEERMLAEAEAAIAEEVGLEETP